MLVLSRKVGENILIPEFGITIQVVSATATRVQLGIEAPVDIHIFREEVLAGKLARESQVGAVQEGLLDVQVIGGGRDEPGACIGSGEPDPGAGEVLSRGEADE